jgi:hypothetical protein
MPRSPGRLARDEDDDKSPTTLGAGAAPNNDNRSRPWDERELGGSTGENHRVGGEGRQISANRSLGVSTGTTRGGVHFPYGIAWTAGVK